MVGASGQRIAGLMFGGVGHCTVSTEVAGRSVCDSRVCSKTTRVKDLEESCTETYWRQCLTSRRPLVDSAKKKKDPETGTKGKDISLHREATTIAAWLGKEENVSAKVMQMLSSMRALRNENPQKPTLPEAGDQLSNCEDLESQVVN